MKRVFPWNGVFGMAVLLLTACKKDEPPQAQTQPQHIVIAKKQTTNTVRIEPPPKPEPPPPPPREISPGTIAYLDSRNGFRDVMLGEKESSIANLVLKSQDDAHQVKTFTRSGDELSLEGVPLESIEYTFFKGLLLEIQLKWSLEHREGAPGLPPPSEVPVRCTALYGPPTRSEVSRASSEFVWRGRQAQLLVTELRLAPILDRVSGGWASPPRTTGRMIIRSVPLAHAAKAAFFTQATEKETGF